MIGRHAQELGVFQAVGNAANVRAWAALGAAQRFPTRPRATPTS